ncbi:MAG: hypothetical protein HYZ29_24980 [Myxococcales bacterium]|nr:hypothetical protein [Myxococcales bacterium]
MSGRLGIVVMSALLLGACSGGTDRPAPPSGSDTQPATAPTPDDGDDPKDAPTGCETGATRTCKVQLPTHGSIETCYLGVNLCVDGEWSECGDEDALVKKYLGG